MIHRRSFLRSPLAANLGRPIPRQRAGASHNDWAYLGRKAWRYLGVPRDQASLRRGLHPIAPERTVRLSKVLADHYRIPAEPWAVALAKREALGSSPLGLGRGTGVALLHQFQFQDDRQVGLANPAVDWWLFLFPEGIEWHAVDDQPVFGMIGHVFESHQPGLQLPVWVLSNETAGAVMMNGQQVDPTAWQRLSRLDRISAARRVNTAVLQCLAGWRRKS